MADPANFAQLQEAYALRHERDVKLTAARTLLHVLDVPQPGDVHLTYVGILRRLQAVITTEIQHEEG